MTLQKWEYLEAEVIAVGTAYRTTEWTESVRKVTQISPAFSNGNASESEHQIEMLHQLGEEGWELVTSFPSTIGPAFLLKRPVRP